MQALPLPDHEIRELARQSRHLNLFPIDLPRIIRDDHPEPLVSLLRKLVAEAAALLQLLTNEEFAGLLAALPPGLMYFIPDTGRETNTERERIALHVICAEVQRVYLSFKRILLPNLDESEVLSAYPELASLFDRDGLLCLDDHFTLYDGGIRYRQHVLQFHQCLRRGFTANPNFDFLSRYNQAFARTRHDNQFRIAIDHNRLTPIDEFLHRFECDAWFGPQFDPSQLDDLQATGLSILGRDPNVRLGSNYDLVRTEIHWAAAGGIKIFEAEEVSSERSCFDQYCLNRYVHSERDTTVHSFRHLDGSVKAYLSSEYGTRLKTHMPQEAKAPIKVKLWRIDGRVDTETWLSLVVYFFKGNEMVLEYFDPIGFRAVVDSREKERLEWLARKARTGGQIG